MCYRNIAPTMTQKKLYFMNKILLKMSLSVEVRKSNEGLCERIDSGNAVQTLGTVTLGSLSQVCKLKKKKKTLFSAGHIPVYVRKSNFWENIEPTHNKELVNVHTRFPRYVTLYFRKNTLIEERYVTFSDHGFNCYVT